VILVLLIDDEESAHLLVKQAMPEGARLDYADNLTAGLTMAAAQEYDLILTDLRMPGTTNGDALTKVLDVCPQTAVLVFTALHYPAYAASLIRQGAVGCVFKPDAAIEPEIAERLLREAMLFAVARHQAQQHQLLSLSQNAQAITELQREVRELRQVREQLVVTETRRKQDEEDIGVLQSKIDLLQAQLSARQTEREKGKWGLWAGIVTTVGTILTAVGVAWLAQRMGWKP
jgi:DNA-binding NtrC family response regulator